MGRIAAFFDVDYTLLAGNSASMYVAWLRKQGKLGRLAVLNTAYWVVRYKLGLVDFETVAGRETAKLAGQSEQEMIEECEQWFREMVASRIYEEGAHMVDAHREKGHEVLLLSAATVYLVRPLARRLGIRHFGCNRLEVDEKGLFTGRIEKPFCFGADKVLLAEKLAEELGLDLSQSFYYSDSITDLPVLERFGEPRVVNPDPLLKREARKRGWPILNFRK